MADRDNFLTWVNTALYDAERALHNGDPGPRRALWSRNEPESVLGAWRNAIGQQELDKLFTSLGRSFSDCTSYEVELLAYDVVGDLANTACFEHTSASVDDRPRTLHLAGNPGLPSRGRRVAGRPSPWGHRDRVTGVIKSPLWSPLTPEHAATLVIAGHDQNWAAPALNSRDAACTGRRIMRLPASGL